MHSSLVNWQTGAWLVTRGELTLQQGEKKPKLKQRDRDKCSADKLASKQMEPDVGRWPSAAATPDFRAVTVGRRTHRTSGRLNGWPVRYVQQRLNVSYRWTSATTNDWMSRRWLRWQDIGWVNVGRLNLTRLKVRRRTVDGFDRWRLVEWTSDISSRTSARKALVGQ